MEVYRIYIDGLAECKAVLEEELKDAIETDIPYYERAIKALSQLKPLMDITTLEEYFNIHDIAYYVTDGFYQTFDGGKYLSLK